MKRVVYHRLAAKELIDSALFYDQCRSGLGGNFLRNSRPFWNLCGRSLNSGAQNATAREATQPNGSLSESSMTSSLTGSGLWPWHI